MSGLDFLTCHPMNILVFNEKWLVSRCSSVISCQTRESCTGCSDAEQLNETVASIVAAVSDLKDDAILRVVIERFGGGEVLLREGSPTSVLLRIADQIESLRKNGKNRSG
jgi:hypothetical protein